MLPKFCRGLCHQFVEKLHAESKTGWWADALADEKLLIAVRNDYLNIYWRGQSLFNVSNDGAGIKVTTHQKYLVDPKLASQVRLADGQFDVSGIIAEGLIDRYEGTTTLGKMKKAAGLYSGLEKTGCHEIAIRNRHVIDCEIAFPASAEADYSEVGDEASTDSRSAASRVDLACIEADKDEARLVFWEAKHYSNNELRARGDVDAPVCGQVFGYRAYLSEHRAEIEESYTRVAQNMTAFTSMRLQRQLSPLITDIGAGKRKLTMHAEPKVGLVVFGFDAGQRDHPDWKNHLKKLQNTIGSDHVRCVGNATKLKLPGDIL